MHWGIRRFQNADGTYTLLGKMRKRENRQATDGSNSGSSKSEKAKSRGRADLSDKTDAELRSAISRMELEKKYRDLDKYLNPEKEHKVKELIKEAGRNALKAALEKHFKAMLGAGDKKDGKGKGKGNGQGQNQGKQQTWEERELKRLKLQEQIDAITERQRQEAERLREERREKRRERRFARRYSDRAHDDHWAEEWVY